MEVRPGYKQTEVGVIPEDWEVKPLHSVLARGRLGGNYPNQETESEFPLMKMGNVARGNFDLSKVEFIAHGATPERQHRLAYGDVLFNTRNTLELVGKVAIWRDELPVAYYNSNLMRLEFDVQEVCSNEYANYALNTAGSVARLRSLATGTTSVAAIYTRDLLGLQFVAPPLPEQRAIAAALSDVDALLGGLDRLIAKKRDLKQAAMQQLLTGQTRLPGFHGEWEVKRLGDIAKLYQPETISQSEFTDYGYPVFGANGVVGMYGRFNHQSAQITISCRGNCGTVNRTQGPAWITGNAMVVNLDESTDVDKAFIYYALAYSDLSILVTGSGIPQIVRDPLAAFAVTLPADLAEQTSIAAVLADMDAELAALETRRDKTRALKQAMMQELLTGRTRLV